MNEKWLEIAQKMADEARAGVAIEGKPERNSCPPVTEAGLWYPASLLVKPSDPGRLAAS